MTTISKQEEPIHDEPIENVNHTQYGRTIFYWILTALIVGLLYVGYLLITGSPLGLVQDLHGFVLEEPAPIGNFQLTDHHGQPVSLADYRGKVVLIYFGYTHCPDVCPATLLELREGRAELKPRFQDDVQVLMVTVDPERDTPELLTSYLKNFDPTFVGLTGTLDQIEMAAAQLGIFYERREVDNTYFIDHTATVVVLDRDGYLRMVWPFGITGEQVASDLNYFVRER